MRRLLAADATRWYMERPTRMRGWLVYATWYLAFPQRAERDARWDALMRDVEAILQRHAPEAA